MSKGGGDLHAPDATAQTSRRHAEGRLPSGLRRHCIIIGARAGAADFGTNCEGEEEEKLHTDGDASGASESIK